MALYHHRGTASSTEKVIKTQPECILPTSAKFCNRNPVTVMVVSLSSGKTSLLHSEWMNQTVSFVKTAPRC